ncbi:hypothetical protein M2352_004227 [Azospirillum fermentarium]|uniref:VWA domain-containing protein n=1 Tax=Azospirillum fermentarium TaxID=1233114 RepID=UPI002225DCB4|nr:VWA domain-containing protein [Azospirillum fermentarium]MCW2248567.1 hypothetical protein [Azospirillum fermentarium]
MPELRIATTGPEGFRRLGMHGQAVVEMHRQIATILNNRLGVQHARCFARPQIDPSSRRIDWYCHDDGPLARPADLPAEARGRVETLSRQLAAEIAQLAGRLKAEGSTGEFVGRMLELALVTPAGTDCLRATGSQPVLILWGHEAEGVAAAVDATAPPAQNNPAQTAPPAAQTGGTGRSAGGAPPAANAGPAPGKGTGSRAGGNNADGAQSVPPARAEQRAGGESGSGPASGSASDPAFGETGANAANGRNGAFRQPDGGGSGGFARPGSGSGGGISGPGGTAPAGWGGRLAWGLPLLLLGLTVVLSMKACEPLPPVVVQVPEPAAPAANPIPALESREKELRDRLALLDRQQADALAQCRPVEPLKKAEAPPQPETPPPAPQQDARLPDPPAPPATPPETVPVRPPAAVLAPPAPTVEAPAVTEAKPVTPPPSLSSIIGAIPEENKTLPPPPRPAPQAQAQAQAQAAPGAAAPGKTPAAPSCNVTYPPGKEPEVVLIVDGSGSMNETFRDSTKIGMARRSITNLANSLPPPVSIGLIDFTGCSNVVRHDFYDAGRRGELIRKVQGLSPSGGTPLARSIERAGNVVSSVAPATIIVVSDGEDTCSGDPCAAARSVKSHKPNVIINVIDISNGSGGQVLQCIAGATGGRVLSPQSGADMINKMQQATRLPDVRNCK